MNKLVIALSIAATTIGIGFNAFASNSPVCAQVVNKTDQTITFNVGNGNYITKIINIGKGLSSAVFRATPVAPKIEFASTPNRSGDISGTFVAYPGAVQLTKDGNISITEENYTMPACNVFWKISVFKG